MPKQQSDKIPTLVSHLADLDHGQLAQLLGDAGLVELVGEISRIRTDLGHKERGQMILDIVGGARALLENSEMRRALFLTYAGTVRTAIAAKLGVESLETFKLSEARRSKLYTIMGESLPIIVRRKIPPAVRCINPRYGLFEHQSIALLACMAFLKDETPKVLLHMPTGAGKTRTAMHLICRHQNNRLKGVVLWLVAGKELCDQARSEFERAWANLGERPLPIISAWEGRTEIEKESFDLSDEGRKSNSTIFNDGIWPLNLQDGIIIGSLDTIWTMTQKWNPAELTRRAANVSLIVFDEAHRAAATTYTKVIESIYSPRHCGLLGLSATPGRQHYGSSDSDTDALVNLFGRNKVQLNIPGFRSPVEALIAQGYLARLEKERLEIAASNLSRKDLRLLNQTLEKALEVPEDTLHHLGLSATRNLQIVERAEKLATSEGHRRVIIFAPSVVSSNLIASVLAARGIESASITAETDPDAREGYIAKFKSESPKPQILCNFGVLTTGFDAPKTSAVIIARPTLSIVLLNQMAGRAIRGPKVGGNANAKLVTVVDTTIPQLVDTIQQFHAFDDEWLH